MKLHDLKPNKGSRKSAIRRGRGNGSKGTFSGRGCKGQNARSGGGVRLGFEGGQTTLIQRTPKLRGFKSRNHKQYAPVNVSALEKNYAAGETVNPETLKEKGLVRKNSQYIKILSYGEISKKLTVENVSYSESARQKIEKAGGEVADAAEKKENKVETKKKEQ